MSLLFQPVSINKLELPNRFVRSATHEVAADHEDQVTPALEKIMTDLAAGGVGLIISGIAYVHLAGRLWKPQLGLAQDSAIPGLRRLAQAVHAHGAKLAMQLFHAGRERTRYSTEEGPALAASVIPGDEVYDFPHREMSEEDIAEAVEAYGQAARRCQEAGVDAVQIHGAHGYLPSQFLSPHTNRRRDRWGGSLDNRLRLHREIARAIRKETGPDYPILIKLGLVDSVPGALQLDEGVEAAARLAQAGYDCLEISQGLRAIGFKNSEFRTGIDSREKEAYFRDWTRQVKQRVKVPVMMVGGLRSLSLMEEVVAQGETDFVSLSRPLIREPDLVNRWRLNPDYHPRCISCNGCLLRIRERKPLACALDLEEKEAKD
ncbi:MAG: NADH:flavin oxidoreductase [Thermodesulfobacteriota bacterium]